MSSNTLLSPTIISREMLMLLTNNLVMANRVNRQFEDQMGAKIGTTLTIRKPIRYTVSEGAALQIQDISEPSTNITITNQSHVGFQFSTSALTLTVEEFRARYLDTAMEQLASRLDVGIMTNISSVYNEVGTPGSTPNTFSSLAAVAQRLDEEAAPQNERTLVLNPKAYWSMCTALQNVYVNSVNEGATKGFLANVANFEIYMDQNIPTQQTGTYSGTPTVTGAGQTGSTLVTGGWTASLSGMLNVGDVFTIAGVNAVNPQSKVATGSLRNFSVTATASSNASGSSSISIYPAITTTGAYATVDAAPAAGAAITVISGASGANLNKNIGFTRDAFGFVTVPLVMPDGVDFKAQEQYKGVSLRVIRAYDINNDVFPTRCDIMWGTNTFYPELACRLTN